MQAIDLPKIPMGGKEDTDYVNISARTPSIIGRKLAFGATFNATNTLIGKITCLRTAMDFIVTPMYPRRLLTKNKLTFKDINKIPKSKEVKVVNYIAILTHLTYLRIVSDEKLINGLMKLKDDVVFTSFDVDKNSIHGMNSKITQYNYPSTRYVFVIQSLFKMFKSTPRDKWDDAILKLISDNKADKNKELFDGVPFDIEVEY